MHLLSCILRKIELYFYLEHKLYWEEKSMAFQVKRISEKKQIETSESFSITRYYACESGYQPKAYGWLGYLENKGFFVKLVCEEKDPMREYKNHRDRVCEESAMEIFMAFPEEGEALTVNCMYTNFEINANGAIYAKYGKGRNNRQFISEEICELAECAAIVEEDKWTLEFIIPEKFLYEICDLDGIKSGKAFYFDFFKIAENKAIEHYGIFAPSQNETPNFHYPNDYVEAVIV